MHTHIYDIHIHMYICIYDMPSWSPESTELESQIDQDGGLKIESIWCWRSSWLQSGILTDFETKVL